MDACCINFMSRDLAHWNRFQYKKYPHLTENIVLSKKYHVLLLRALSGLKWAIPWIVQCESCRTVSSIVRQKSQITVYCFQCKETSQNDGVIFFIAETVCTVWSYMVYQLFHPRCKFASSQFVLVVPHPHAGSPQSSHFSPKISTISTCPLGLTEV